MQRFDDESGLVFEETVVKAPRHHEVPWEHRVGRVNKRWKAYREDTLRCSGVESLYAKAMREVVRNAHTLTTEMLEDLPSTIVTRIWHEIRRERKESVHIFKLFAGSRHGDSSFAHSATLTQFALRKPLVDYFDYFSSPSFAWMTDLAITKVSCTAGELKQLHNLANLRRLTIRNLREDSVYSFHDDILGYWAIRARDQNEFSCLENLSVSSAPGITSRSFKFLGHFSALQTALFYETSIRRKDTKFAMKYGWSIELEGGLASRIRAWHLKCTYENAAGLHGFGAVDDIVQSYVANERPNEGKYDNQPALVVKFTAIKDQRRSVREYDYLDKMLCFERDRSLSALPLDQSAMLSVITDEIPTVSKKRKMKDGKAVRLDSLLASF